MTLEQHDAFQKRLNRIAINSIAAPHVTEQAQLEKSRIVRILGFALLLIRSLVSGLLIFICISALRVNLVALYGAGRFAGVMDNNPTWVFLDLAATALVCWALNKFYKMQRVSLAIVQQVGALLLAASIHNLAFWAPHTMSVAMTGDWVRMQQLESIPNALFLGWRYIRFSTKQAEYAPASNVTPKVVYRN